MPDMLVGLLTGLAVLLPLGAAATLIDVRHMVIPNWLNAALAATGITWVALFTDNALIQRCFETVAGAGILWLATTIYAHIRGMKVMGFGDIKFIAAAGLWVGALGLPWLLLVACISGLIWAIVKSACGEKLNSLTRLPFAPHLSFGLCSTWLLQQWGTIL